MTPDKQKIAYILIGLVIGSAAMFLFQKFILPQPVKTVLLETSNEFNRSCPLMVDRITRFDNTSVENNEFRFTYTITNAVKDSVDASELKNYLEPVVRQGISKYPQVGFFKQNHITISCLYKDRFGAPLTEIKVQP